MAKDPSSDNKEKPIETPQPQTLKPQDGTSAAPAAASAPAKPVKPIRHGTYRPSHKATFIGLGVVIAILAANVAGIMFLMKAQDDAENQARAEEVVLSPATLDTLGVSRNPVDNLGMELVVGPNSRFNGDVTVGGDVSISGELRLNNTFLANNARFANLQAGNTSLGQLNVNGDGTVTNLNVRQQLVVAGQTRLQAPVTMDQMLTVNNNVNIAGSLAVGGTLSAGTFQTNSLVVGSTITLGGHIITRGAAPGVSKGGALAGVDTVSISGSDAAGTVAVNTGGTRSGIVANVSFRNAYGTTPRVVVTAIGGGVSDLYINRNSGGFSIGVSSIGGGGHAFDYIVMQ